MRLPWSCTAFTKILMHLHLNSQHLPPKKRIYYSFYKKLNSVISVLSNIYIYIYIFLFSSLLSKKCRKLKHLIHLYLHLHHSWRVMAQTWKLGTCQHCSNVHSPIWSMMHRNIGLSQKIKKFLYQNDLLKLLLPEEIPHATTNDL